MDYSDRMLRRDLSLGGSVRNHVKDIGIVRSLGRVGVPVVAADHDPQALGLLSRHARPASLGNTSTGRPQWP